MGLLEDGAESGAERGAAGLLDAGFEEIGGLEEDGGEGAGGKARSEVESGCCREGV